MNKYNQLINTLKEYKLTLILKQLSYKTLNINNRENFNIIKEIISFDKNKTCFGDYNYEDSIILENLYNYVNIAIYLNQELIGYFGFCYSHPKDLSRIMFVLTIKEEYRNLGLGDIIIKQAINTMFLEYNSIKSIYITIVENNIPSIKLIEKNNFHKFKGYRENDYFQINGKEYKQEHYLYTIKDFKNNKKILRKYKNIFNNLVQ